MGAGADPFVTQWDGYYYMVNTTGNNVRMERAEKLEHIHISDSQSNSLVVWDPPGGLSYSEQIWAPELHRINDKWYIYVAASDGSNAQAVAAREALRLMPDSSPSFHIPSANGIANISNY